MAERVIRSERRREQSRQNGHYAVRLVAVGLGETQLIAESCPSTLFQTSVELL